MKTLGQLASGEVVVDREISHIHGEIEALLQEALARVCSRNQGLIVEEVDFGKVIGVTTRVLTLPDDQILFAIRPGRQGYSRFVVGRQPEPCSALTVVLKKSVDVEDIYILSTAYVGTPAEPEPWDLKATPQSLPFWQTHALLWGSESIIPGTDTDQCQW